jgi:hypothetical protein
MSEEIEIGDEVESIDKSSLFGIVCEVDSSGAYFKTKGSDYINYRFFKNLNLRRKKMERVKEGDVIVNCAGEKAKIILANDKVFIKSAWGRIDTIVYAVYDYIELKVNNWKLYNPNDDLIEVCCEGKKAKIKKGDASKKDGVDMKLIITCKRKKCVPPVFLFSKKNDKPAVVEQAMACAICKSSKIVKMEEEK